MAPRRRARAAAAALAFAAQLCLAGSAVVTPSAVAATPVAAAPSAAATAPAPAPSSMPHGTVADITIGLLVTGLSSYTPATQQALAAAVASVANSAAPSAAPITAADVQLNASSYAASAALVLQGCVARGSALGRQRALRTDLRRSPASAVSDCPPFRTTPPPACASSARSRSSLACQSAASQCDRRAQRRKAWRCALAPF